MKQTASNDLLQGVNRRISTRREIPLKILFEFGVDHRGSVQSSRELGHGNGNNNCAFLLEFVNGSANDSGHFLLVGGVSEQIVKSANACALLGAGLKCIREMWSHLAGR